MSEKTGGLPRFYNRAEAAAYLKETWGQRTSTKTLAKQACQGGGPPFSYAGRYPVYEEMHLDQYARNRMRGPYVSTTEAMASVSRQVFQKNRAGEPRQAANSKEDDEPPANSAHAGRGRD